MKVLIVSNNVYMKGNGVSSAVVALRSRLINKGVDVRVIACENPDKEGPQPDYPLKHYVFPIFEPIIRKNGFRYASIDKHIIREAVSWADVVHLMEGFPFEATTAKIAKQLGKPCVGTYHTFTENITANLGSGKSTFINKLINKWWSSAVYNHCKYVQCPTQTVKEHLEANGYTSELRVITNGIDLSQTPTTISEPSTPPYRILCVGRLSNEKDQTTLIKAIRYSKYADKIELVFAGNGPKANKIKRAARKLYEEGVVKHEPTFGFYTLKQLQELAASSWLYVHCAKIEVEVLSCIEAIQQGLVPVIANGRLTATSQFALDEHSTFPTSDYKALAERIDWWIEHPEHRRAMSQRYAESVQKYSAEESTRKIIEMYEMALRS